MRLWGSHGRRPMGWWEFEAGDLKHPGYFRERSALWRAGVLSDDEKAFLERDWRREFDAAREKDARERREHYEHHDIPAELVARWKGESRRRSRAAEAPEKAAPDVASGVEGEAKELHVSGQSLAQPPKY